MSRIKARDIPSTSKTPEAPSTPPRPTTSATEHAVAQTPTQKQPDDDDSVYDCFIYAQDAGQLRETINKEGKTYTVFTIFFRNPRKAKLKFEAWGQAEAVKFRDYFQKCFTDYKCQLFEIPNADTIPDTDSSTLFWKPTAPTSTFDMHLDTVYKLSTKKGGGFFGERKLTTRAFPTMKQWVPNKFYLSGNKPLPPPDTWWHEEEVFVYDDLFVVSDMTVPNKKAKIGEA